MTPTSRDDEFVDKKVDEGGVLKFQMLLAEGKQAYISGRFKEAETKLSEAAELSVNIYGYFTIPTFEPHLYYGKTLLELARLEDGVFSNALQGITATGEEVCKKRTNDKDDDIEEVQSLTEEERAETVERVENAWEENAEALEEKIACCRVDSSGMLENNKEESEEKRADVDAVKNEADVTMEGDRSSTEKEQTKGDYVVKTDKEDEDETMGHKEKRSNTEGERDENMEDEKKEGNDGVEDEKEDDKLDEGGKDGISEENNSKDESSNAEDVEYLQLAWENLEVARTICDKHLEEEGWKEKKVEVLLDLADCSTDAENYKQAVDDIDACILLTKSIFGEIDRRVAQAYFVKGRTHNLAKDFGNAAKVFGKSKEILEARLTELESQLANASQGEAEKIKKEVYELKPLLPEIQTKIDDSLESERSLTKESIFAGDEGDISLKSSVGGMPIDDVSNLVRKKLKRSAEDEAQRKPKKTKASGDVENAAVDS
ncbi:hypothetical protein LOAG_04513 [Loa loa]|nr:hypothetical protein LOAG_04513 [Loa loa]EFO23971.2 hypothetical protein LOAG_04513 [Loa loa]